ncbi:MAG TPA: hypothetical protein VMW56_03335 [Candidatus Margulisiibacteriota bacterium]|nr:hypothetical protein [Candidatus Margulisiibacteriota bacterium]
MLNDREDVYISVGDDADNVREIMAGDAFEQLEATLLLCPQCRVAVPVRKRLLLILPQGNKFEYLCSRCASICGDKIEPDVPPPERRYM